MAQISRPFQIALVAVGLLACVWYIALRGHSSSTGGAGSTPSESSSTATHAASLPQAPGVPGLAKDVEKARGAAKASEQNAAQLNKKSAEASSDTTSAAAPSATAAPSHVASAPAKQAAPAKPAAKPVASRQQSVEAQLKSGAVVVLLFWNPNGIDDRAVHKEVRAIAGSRKVALQEASAKEAAAFGTITRGVQLYSTPTVLVINAKGEAHVITGLTDAYALRQAIAEARKS